MDTEGLVPPELFYVGLTVWVSSDPLGLAASQANFYPPPPEWLHDKYDTTGENLRSESQGEGEGAEEPRPGPHRPYPKALPTAPRAHWPPLLSLPHPPLHSPGGPAPGVCPVPLPTARPPEDGGLCGGHRGGPGSMRRGRPGRGACLPQRLPLPLLGAVPGPAALLPAGRLHPAGVHLPRLCPAAAQPLDGRPHSESLQGWGRRDPGLPTLSCPPITPPPGALAELCPPRCWSWQ